MIEKGERRAHSTRIDRCSLVREKIDYHGGAGLETAPDAGGEYDPLVSSR